MYESWEYKVTILYIFFPAKYHDAKGGASSLLYASKVGYGE